MALLKYLILVFLVSCSGLFYHPDRYKYVEPKKIGLDYEDVFFKSDDGSKIHGWHFKTNEKKKKGIILFSHGNAQNISAHFIALAWIVKHGYDLFVFDYQGYGLSEGGPSQKNTVSDMLGALNYTHGLVKKDKDLKFITYGQSLGGVVLLRALEDFKHKNDIDLVVLDSTFDSYKDMGFSVATSNWFTFLISPLAYLLVSDEYMPTKIFKEDLNFLVIHGDKDQIVDKKFGKKIFNKLKSNRKSLWVVEQGRHIDIFNSHQGKYRDMFVDFLESI